MGSGGGGTPYATDITGMTGGRVIPGANSTPNIVNTLSSRIGTSAGIVGGSYTVPTFDATGFLIMTGGGGGGGWGAAGGAMLANGTANTTVYGTINPGGAGGKAINTNTNTVTFIGGSGRVFGVIG